MAYMSETEKFRDMPEVMKYITGRILDIGCGGNKITHDSVGVDGRLLDGVDVICDRADDYDLLIYFRDKQLPNVFDTVFSSHFLEHCPNQHQTIMVWSDLLKRGGHLVLYLPDGRHYDNKENEEHMVDMNHDQFIFWFKRVFCGEGKNFKGEHLPKMFELVDHGLDVGEDRYSFYVIAKKV